MSHKALELAGFFGMTQTMENRYEIWNMEYEKSLWGRFTDNSSK
jgi:hypothetical protein